MRTFFTQHSSQQQNEIALNKIQNNKQLALFSCDISRSVLPIWLNQFPDDKIVPNLIQTTEDFIFGLTDLKQLNIARNNAYNNSFYAASNASNAAYFSANAASNAASYIHSLVYTTSANIHNAFYSISHAASASNNEKDQYNFTYQLYLQTFKPTHITIPKLPIFIELAHEIKSTRNFKLYNVLTDAIMDYSNIKIKTNCLGLSNWLLFHLLLK